MKKLREASTTIEPIDDNGSRAEHLLNRLIPPLGVHLANAPIFQPNFKPVVELMFRAFNKHSTSEFRRDTSDA
jgi:hypothetical protein